MCRHRPAMTFEQSFAHPAADSGLATANAVGCALQGHQLDRLIQRQARLWLGAWLVRRRVSALDGLGE